MTDRVAMPQQSKYPTGMYMKSRFRRQDTTVLTVYTRVAKERSHRLRIPPPSRPSSHCLQSGSMARVCGEVIVYVVSFYISEECEFIIEALVSECG
jgi:hypothetical protein